MSVNSFTLSNSSIYGNVSIGTSDYTGLDVGPGGLVGAFGTSAGTVDYSKVTTDFTTNFEDAVSPATAEYTITGINSPTALPRFGDIPAADGTYYYDVPGIALSGAVAQKLDISAGMDVVIRITAAAGTTGVSVTGNASINVLAGGSLEMYTEPMYQSRVAVSPIQTTRKHSCFTAPGLPVPVDHKVSVSVGMAN